LRQFGVKDSDEFAVRGPAIFGIVGH
jgi:hypothetical protein